MGGRHRRGAHADVRRTLREESAGGLEESSQGVLESATASPLRGLPNLMKRQRYGRQHQGIRTPACFTVPDLWNTRVRSEGHWPRAGRKFALARTVQPRRPTKRSLVARRSLSYRRPAQK